MIIWCLCLFSILLANQEQVSQDELEENLDYQEQTQEAFDSTLTNLYPLSASQILAIKDLYEDAERATQADVSPPKPTISSQQVSLAPGNTPPIIRLSHGFVSSLVFLDATGATWPIESYNIGDPNSFSLQWNGSDNIIVVQAKTMFKYGNLVVRLKGLATPVVITLIPGQKEVDYRRELRITQNGPNAVIVGPNVSGQTNTTLLDILNGVIPSDSIKLSTSEPDFNVYYLHGKYFVRTNFSILSPAWEERIQSSDGTYAYMLNDVTNCLISKHGKIKQIEIMD